MKFSIDTVILAIELVGVLSFAASGAMTGLRKNMDLFGVCILGLTTAVGGGVLRDMMAGNTPYIFVKHVYACASLAGAMLCAGLWRWAGSMAAMLAGMATVVLIRVLAAHYHWNLPKAKQ